jgi:hypothetical protein
MDETYRITPSTTLNRGQNSELILQNIWLHWGVNGVIWEAEQLIEMWHG